MSQARLPHTHKGTMLAQGHAVSMLASSQDPCSLKANPQECLQAYKTCARARPCRKHARKLAGPVLAQGQPASMPTGLQDQCSRNAMPQACQQVRGILIQRLG
ncbi:hypothetical protein NE237_013229 [Protea cynaroides]|uniref:Uncharacterized protein n=1 Tax=Protea cynaroides TaxID=273540 RepID=A0A9Q0JYB5_9MAGN|nr:hypothetical protein NE237_013229 [Protea cynaroides]